MTKAEEVGDSPVVGFVSQRSVSLIDPDIDSKGIDRVRETVGMTREAVRAISITALEAVREGALFMGVIGTRGELVNPFAHIDAPIWSENEVPESIVETAYDYCEELTRREAGNFYHSFKYLPDLQRRAICAYYAFCRRADDIADGDYVDYFPGEGLPMIQNLSITGLALRGLAQGSRCRPDFLQREDVTTFLLQKETIHCLRRCDVY